MSESLKQTKKRTEKKVTYTGPAKRVTEAHSDSSLVPDSASPAAVKEGDMSNKLVPLLLVIVIIGSFVVGTLYGKVSVYEKGATPGSGTTAAQNQAVGNQQAAPQVMPTEAPLSDEQWESVLENPVAEKGNKNANVTMVEFTDYQCPFCARYYTDSYRQILSEYVDTNKIRYILRDLPLAFHPQAKPAALAARCAGDQNKYWEMHDVLFEKQTEWSNGEPKEKFQAYAGEVGLNVTTFMSCYDSGKYNEAIDNEMTLANSVGATGTPTFIINGEKIVGAMPVDNFKQALDKALEG